MIDRRLQGLCITKMHPEMVREEYSLRKGTIFWLSKTEAPGIKSIPSTNLGMLRDTMSDFIKGNERCVILLDGLEYLITENGFDVTLKFLHDVWELVATAKSRLMVPVNPAALDEKELGLLETNMELVPIAE